MTSANDQAVLNRIFNPLLPAEIIAGEQDDDVLLHESDQNISEQLAAAKKLEISGVNAAESGNLDEALSLFTRAIETCPQDASAYNNRAQTLRLQGNIDDALSDLNMAIELSGGKGRAACQAYVQRAMISRLQTNEDSARSDYEKAAALGSSFAKMQLVSMNPYAAMCNKMLAQVMGKLQRGEPTDQELDHAA